MFEMLYLGHGGGDDLHAGVGRVVGALALLRVVVAHPVRVLLVKGLRQQ